MKQNTPDIARNLQALKKTIHNKTNKKPITKQ